MAKKDAFFTSFEKDFKGFIMKETKRYFVVDLIHDSNERNNVLNFLKRNNIRLIKKVKRYGNRERECVTVGLPEIEKALAINKAKVVFSQEITDSLEVMKKRIEEGFDVTEAV